MATTMREIMNPCLPTGGQPGFPHAPLEWTEEYAKILAKAEEIELNPSHWELVRALQSYFCRNEQQVNSRELLDALNEKFHAQGGIKYLYEILPGGPIAQGCRLAGLPHLAGIVDKS